MATPHHAGQSDRDVTIPAKIQKNSKGDGGKEHPTVYQGKRRKAILRMIKPDGQVVGADLLDAPKRRLPSKPVITLRVQTLATPARKEGRNCS